MACRFEVTLSGEDAEFLGAARDALDEVDRVEDALSLFRETSEIRRINREAASGPVTLAPELVRLLSLCRRLHALTGGAFDPSSTPLSRAWGFLARRGRVPTPDQIAAAKDRVGMDKVVLDPERSTLRFLHPGMELNLGSIGKGYALDRIALLLRRRGVRRALLSAAGSSVLAFGGGREGFSVRVRSRLVAGGSVASLRLRDAALATSGAGEQAFEAGGERYGHVLDPRSGRPAEGVVSASFVAGEAAVADALATAVSVAGLELAEAYCAAHPGTLALVSLAGATRPHVIGRRDGVEVEVG